MKKLPKKTVAAATVVAYNGELMKCTNGYPEAHFWVSTGERRGDQSAKENRFVCQHCGGERWFPCSQIARFGLWGGKGKKKGGRKKQVAGGS